MWYSKAVGAALLETGAGVHLELLAKHGCSHATMTLMYLGKKIEEYFGEEPYEGITLRYSYETTPLGTAGSVKNAVRSASEPLLIISGDAMCDFDLTSAMAISYAKRSGGYFDCKKSGRSAGIRFSTH